MTVPINPTPLPNLLERVDRPSPVPSIGPAQADTTESFSDRVSDMIESTDASQREAQGVSDAFADGKNNDIHGTMVSLAKADIQLRLLGSVRNKLVDAYREIMRMGA